MLFKIKPVNLKRYFHRHGFVVWRSCLSNELLTSIEDLITAGVRAWVPEAEGPNDPKWVKRAQENPSFVAALYDQLRDSPELLMIGKRLGTFPLVTSLVKNTVIYKKIPLRIDVPFESKELAFWHQDHHYVKGNQNEITLWVPLFDCTYFDGCLMVMPGSHKLGAIDHAVEVGKKQIPPSIFSHPVKYLEINRGDALIFHTLLLHSGSLNISEQIRYSIQFRYSSEGSSMSNQMIGAERCLIRRAIENL